MGDEQAPLDREAVEKAIRAYAPKVAAFAVSGYFSVRNPAHELAVKAMVREIAGLPVTCGHELTSKLDAPRRALTVALNARLIPQLQQLIRAVEGILRSRSIEAPLMVVKGDGSLIAAEVALNCPVETILSGPAASLVGAHHLCGSGDVVVSDMGGTTTDVAMLSGGRPVLNREGAIVGGWRTMVEAVAVHSYGLGGDSELRLDETGGLILGPRRSVPLSLLGAEHPRVIEKLKHQVEEPIRVGYDGQFLRRLRRLDTKESGLRPDELDLWEALEPGPLALSDFLQGPAKQRAMKRPPDRGLAILSSFTPSDAAHALGLQKTWSQEAAELGARLWIRRLDALGGEKLKEVEPFCQRVVEQAVRQSVAAILGTAFDQSLGVASDRMGALGELVMERMAAGTASESPLVTLDMNLKRPLVGIGAPAATYYTEIARRLGARLIVPPHADVCNAVGAVAGGVLQRVELLILQPTQGCFRVHLPDGVVDFKQLDAAVERAEAAASSEVRRLAQEAGAAEPEINIEREDKVVTTAGTTLFIESRIRATAFGRPRLATAG
jgi:N-methylhydantoinase A/oxoprolinase/acetone carboxylase beta subunit